VGAAQVKYPDSGTGGWSVKVSGVITQVGSRWSRIMVRAMSVALLVAGVGGGLYLDRLGDDTPAAHFATLPEADEMQLLRAQQNRYAVTRSVRQAAEGEAASAAAGQVRRAAGKARKKEKAVIAKAAQEKAKAGAVFAGPIPGSCKEYSGNRATGCALMLSAGFGMDQFPCLEKLWDHESGWNHRAENKGSGAYGIPQAYPGSKMSSVGADWRTNPATQIKWGLGYVKGRYNTPCGAWSNFQNNGSY
jgi:hypothetical protein